MDFCPECGFKYNVVELEGKLMNLCKNCGHEEENTKYIVEIRKVKDDVGEEVNPDIVNDPTYARTRKVKCPNPDCESRKDKSKQEAIIYQSPTTLKGVYFCRVCATQWSY